MQLIKHLPGLVEARENGRRLALIRRSRWTTQWTVQQQHEVGKVEHFGTFQTYGEARSFVAQRLAGVFW